MNRCSSHQREPFAFKLYKIIIIVIAVILISSFILQNSSLFYRKTIILPFSLHLNRQELFMVKGEEFRLYVFGINIRVSYSSSNFRVAGVNFNGRVTAHHTGTAFIIAKVNGKQLKCRVHVIDINKKNLSLDVGDSYRLRIYGTNSFSRWRSSDSKVATINMFGTVKAKKKGSTIVYARMKGKIIKCKVRVK